MKRIKCKRCEYKWNYKGKKVRQVYAQYTTCPNCRTLVKLYEEGNKR